MFQFRRFPAYAYLIQRTLTEYCSAGFPHSEICGSKLICSSPQLIAACHVLLRLLMPRHSPCALSSLTFVGASSVSFVSSPRKALRAFLGGGHGARRLCLPLPRRPIALGSARRVGSHQELCRLQSSLATLFYPFTRTAFAILFKSSTTFAFALCCLLRITFNLHCSVFKVQASGLSQDQIETSDPSGASI